MSYESPKVADYGKLVDLTAALADGERLDRDFPAGTPKKDLTFS